MWHPLINLSLNSYIILTKFKMETVSSVLGLIMKLVYMFLINLKDAWFQRPIHTDSYLIFGLHLEGKPTI